MTTPSPSTPKDTPTPRCDAVKVNVQRRDRNGLAEEMMWEAVPADFARTLERERNQLQREWDEWNAWCYTSVGTDNPSNLKALLVQAMDDKTLLAQKEADLAKLTGELGEARRESERLDAELEKMYGQPGSFAERGCLLATIEKVAGERDEALKRVTQLEVYRDICNKQIEGDGKDFTRLESEVAHLTAALDHEKKVCADYAKALAESMHESQQRGTALAQARADGEKLLKWEQRDWAKPYAKKGEIESSTWHAMLESYGKHGVELFRIHNFDDGYFVSFELVGHKAIKDAIKTLDEAKAVAQKEWANFTAAIRAAERQGKEGA